LGTTESIVATGRVQLAGSDGGSRSGSIELPNAATPQPRIGLRSSRLARFRFSIDGAPMAVEAVCESSLAPLTEFLVVGPFAWDWHGSIGEVAYGPEAGPVRPDASFDGR